MPSSDIPIPVRNRIVATLLISSFVAILNQTLLVTALPPIMADLQIPLSSAQWLTSIFLLVNGVMIPVSAFLTGTFTTRQLFLGALGLFMLGTAVAALSPNFAVLIVGRILQAAAAGITMPLMQIIILTIFPLHRRGQAMGLVGLVISFAPAIGPTLSGYLVQHYPWRSLFLVVLPIMLANFVFAWRVMRNVTERTFPKLDLLSIVLSTIGFGSMLYGFSIAGTAGWGSRSVVTTLAVGLVTLLVFVVRQFRLPEPILEFRVFNDPIYTLTNLVGVIMFASMISAETLLPVLIQDMLGYTPLHSGLVLLPGAIAMGILTPICGRLFDRHGARGLALTGLSLLLATSLLLTRLSPQTTLAYLTFVYTFRMAGISMVMMPLTTAGINRLPFRLIPHGAAMNNTLRQVGGSMGTALLVTVATMFAGGETAAGAIRGVNAAFWVSSALALVGLVLAYFIRGTKPKAQIEEQSA